jgi:heptaprenyl diphosphate synthase
VRTANDNSDWLVCEQTRLAAAQLGLFLRKAVTAEDVQIRVMALDLIERGGKRLRPSLLFLAATYGEFVQDPLMRAAAALELVHIASLYHDDVMDRAPMRRNGASVNARWGNALAALAGTYLFARASALLASLGDIPNQMASQASVEL